MSINADTSHDDYGDHYRSWLQNTIDDDDGDANPINADTASGRLHNPDEMCYMVM